MGVEPLATPKELELVEETRLALPMGPSVRGKQSEYRKLALA